MSIGGLVAARVAMKPLATLNRPVLETVDVVTKEPTVCFRERTDVTAVPAMGVVAETMAALVLASEALRKFGGDSLAEVVRNRDGFVAALGETPSAAARRTGVGAEADRRCSCRHDGRRQDHRRPARGRPARAGPYVDSDAEVEAATGRTVPEIFAEQGEAAFRAAEAEALAAAVAGGRPGGGLGGRGAVLDPANRALIRRSGTVVWLRANPATLAGRVGDGAGRPLLRRRPGEELARLEAVRRPLYAEVADVAVDVDGLTPERGGRAVLAPCVGDDT